jgi:hypothetical protein
MRNATVTFVCCTVILSLLTQGCSDDPVAPQGYSKVTPASIPGTTVEILEPIQLTEKARIPENDPAYKSVEVFKDRLVLHYSSAPTIALAAGNVVAGGDKIGYLRKITSVTQQGATALELKTQNAYLGELIYKGHFRVTQEPLAKGWESVGGDINSRCYPLGPENSYSVFKSSGAGTSLECKVSAGATLKLEPSLIITPKLIFEVDFDPGWLLIDGELIYAKFVLDGTVEAGVKLTGKGVLSAKCEADIIKALRERSGNDQLFKLWLPTLRFAVGPVPVVITHYIEPIAKSTLEAKLEVLEVIGTGQVKLGVKAGTEYKNKKWSPIWQPSRSGSLDLKWGDDLFKVSLSDELAFGLGYTALIYSTAGPKLGLTLGTTLSASASPDTCKWDAKLELGVNFEYGAELQVPVLDKKIWDATGKVELFKTEIFKTGGDIPSCQADAGVEAGADAGPEMGVDATADLGADGPLPPDSSTHTWQYVKVEDCSSFDVKPLTTSATPLPANCNSAFVGKIAVCWDGATYNNSNHNGKAICTYKSKTPSTCTGGKNPGKMYVCQ